MNRWARIQLGIAALGAVLFLITFRQGLAVAAQPTSFPLHTQLALVATFLALLGWLWVIVYLLVSRRWLVTKGRLDPTQARSVDRAARVALLTAALAAASTAAHVLLAGRLFTRPGSGGIHLASAAVTGGIQLVALVSCTLGLSRHQRLLERQKSTDRVLDSAGS